MLLGHAHLIYHSVFLSEIGFADLEQLKHITHTNVLKQFKTVGTCKGTTLTASINCNFQKSKRANLIDLFFPPLQSIK